MFEVHKGHRNVMHIKSWIYLKYVLTAIVETKKEDKESSFENSFDIHKIINGSFVKWLNGMKTKAKCADGWKSLIIDAIKIFLLHILSLCNKHHE